MAYGLQVWSANGSVRMDTADREFRYVVFFTGNLGAGSSRNITVAGLTNDGTWGLNETQGSEMFIRIRIRTGYFRLTNNGPSAKAYKVQVFRI